MGGWFADIFIEFVVRVACRWIAAFRSRNWTLVRAARFGAFVHLDGFSSCAKVLISYTYSYGGQLYANHCTEPFLFEEDAREYADYLRGLNQTLVRIDRSRPTESTFRDIDQRLSSNLVSQLVSEKH